MDRVRLGLSRVLAGLAILLAVTSGQAIAWAGTISTFSFQSAALGRQDSAEVYLPSGTAPDEGWPVLYLLHGLRGTPEDWNSLGHLGKTVDDMISSRRIRPMVIVMPRGESAWYVDSADVGGPGNYATAIGHDVQAAVEAAYPVGRDRAHRAIGGLSMGGYGALRLALLAPERYAAVAVMSPAIWQNIPITTGPVAHDRAPAPSYFQHVDPATITIGVDLPPDGSHFGAAFGTPFNPRRFNDDNVFTLLERDVEARKPLPAMFMSCGDDDSHRLIRGSIAFFETMQANNLPIEFRITDGDHNWALWRTTLPDVLTFASDHLDQPAVR